eukprot:884930-Rhodomonas_salina.3
MSSIGIACPAMILPPTLDPAYPYPPTLRLPDVRYSRNVCCCQPKRCPVPAYCIVLCRPCYAAIV